MICFLGTSHRLHWFVSYHRIGRYSSMPVYSHAFCGSWDKTFSSRACNAVCCPAVSLKENGSANKRMDLCNEFVVLVLLQTAQWLWFFVQGDMRAQIYCPLRSRLTACGTGSVTSLQNKIFKLRSRSPAFNKQREKASYNFFHESSRIHIWIIY